MSISFMSYTSNPEALNIEAASVRDAVRALGKLLLDWTKVSGD